MVDVVALALALAVEDREGLMYFVRKMKRVKLN